MKRLLPLLLIALLAIAACGGSGSDSTATPDDSGRSATETAGTPTPAPRIVPTGTPTPLPTEPATPTKNPDGTGNEAGSGENDSEPTAEGTPVDVPDPSPTPIDPVPTPQPTPTKPAGEPIPVVYPTFPPIPVITSCEHAADLSIESMQIWLDALGGVPEEALWDESQVPADLEEFMAQMDNQMDAIESQASDIGCTTGELEELIFARFDQLVANNDTAEAVLELLWELAPNPNPVPTPDETIEPTEEFIDTRFETCEQAADLFIELLQALVFDEITAMTLEELEANQEPPESVLQFIEEVVLMRTELAEVGCTETEVTALIGERLDQLVVTGEAAEEIFASLEDVVAEGNLFDDIS